MHFHHSLTLLTSLLLAQNALALPIDLEESSISDLVDDLSEQLDRNLTIAGRPHDPALTQRPAYNATSFHDAQSNSTFHILNNLPPIGDDSGSSAFNAKRVTINVSGGPSSWECDCEAILCQGKPRTLQRDSKSKAAQKRVEERRKQSGASKQPFAHLAEYFLSRPDRAHTSAEEYPWASTVQGGFGASICPATDKAQQSQGGTITQMYKRYNIRDGTWFYLDFEGPFIPGGYCQQLSLANPFDTTKCYDDLSSEAVKAAGYDVGKYTWRNTIPQFAGSHLDFHYYGKNVRKLRR